MMLARLSWGNFLLACWLLQLLATLKASLQGSKNTWGQVPSHCPQSKNTWGQVPCHCPLHSSHFVEQDLQ